MHAPRAIREPKVHKVPTRTRSQVPGVGDYPLTLAGWGLTNQANRPRADGARAPPASGPVEREVRAKYLHTKQDTSNLRLAENEKHAGNHLPQGGTEKLPGRKHPTNEPAGSVCDVLVSL